MRRTAGTILIGMIVLLWQPSASALDPTRSLAQYKHTRWTVDDGAPVIPYALAQGADGYLWIGARDGLFRFDGIRFEFILPERQIGNRTSVTALLAARDGSIWAGYGAGGIARYDRGILRDIAMPHADVFVISITQSRDGAIWVALGRPDLPLMRYANGRWMEFGAARGIAQDQMHSLIATRDGSIWAAYRNSIRVLRKGATQFEIVTAARTGHATLSEDAAGRVWLSDEKGSRPIAGPPLSGVSALSAYTTLASKRGTRAFFDRDGNLWGKPAAGIFRVRAADQPASGGASVRAAAVETFGAREGLTGDQIGTIIEDREGNIWVSTTRGLDRFRAAAVTLEPQLTNRAQFGDVLLAASDGTVYVGEADTVFRIRPGGQPEPILQHTKDVEALCEGPDKAVWIVLPERIVRLRAGRLSALDRPRVEGDWVRDCAVDRDNVLWLSAGSLGLFRRSAAGWQKLTKTLGANDSSANFLWADRNRDLQLVAEPNRVIGISYSRNGGLKETDLIAVDKASPLPKIRTLLSVPSGLLLGGQFGLARWTGSKLQILASERFPALNNLTGIVQTPDGYTWTIGRLGLARWSSAEIDAAFVDPRHQIEPVVFDDRDGAPSNYIVDATRALVRGGDGRLWVSTYNGTVSIDPARIKRNMVPAPVVISGLKARGVTYRDPAKLELRAGTSSLEIDFAVPSLSVPQRVRVFYKLDGADREWVDPGMRRQVFYTNLGPGRYTFQVIAANDSGVLNRTGATLTFDIPPTFLQSKWFAALCVLGAILLLWMIYHLRVRQLQATMRMTLEQRLAERERIARDLHDTLLQGFQGLIFRFQSVANTIPAGDITRRHIEQALDSADDVLTQGRNSVTQLRAARTTDLVQAFTQVAEQLGQDHAAKFNLVVEGVPRELHPMVSEELCRIGEEALINAFRHSDAGNIEVAIAYGSHAFGLGIRDDGTGIGADIVAQGGREGHFGLAGMRERADQIDAQFEIASRAGAGTEIVVTVPAGVAYAHYRGSWFKRLFVRGARG